MGFAALSLTNICREKLPRKTSIVSADLYVVRAVVCEILESSEENKSYTILSDFRRALLALKSSRFCSPIVEKIKHKSICSAELRNIRTDLCLVPGYGDSAGNQKADAAEKEAARSKTAIIYKAFPYTDRGNQ